MADPAAKGLYHAAFTYTDEVLSDFEAMYLKKKEITPVTRIVKPGAAPAPDRIADKHYMRKHGPNAYYGQGNH